MDAQLTTTATMGRSQLVTSTRSPARLLSAVAVLAFALVSGAVRADVVSDWNAIAFDTFKAANVSGNPLFRALAIMHVAMSDAVNTVQNRYTRYALNIPLNPAASADAAAVTAARGVLVTLARRKRRRWTMSTQWRWAVSPTDRGKSRELRSASKRPRR